MDSQQKNLFVEEIEQFAVDQVHLGDVRHHIDREHMLLNMVDDGGEVFSPHFGEGHHRPPDFMFLHDLFKVRKESQKRNVRGLLAGQRLEPGILLEHLRCLWG